jgi:hypothetical protein
MCRNSRLCCNIRFLIVYSVSMHNDPSTLRDSHIRCDARAHNRSIATAQHQPRRPLFAPYASATSTEPTETLPKASPDTAPPLRTRRHNTRWSQIGSMEGVPGLTERSHGHRATRTWVSLYHRADVEEVATAPCGPLDARSLRLAPAGGSGSGNRHGDPRRRGDGIDQRGR